MKDYGGKLTWYPIHEHVAGEVVKETTTEATCLKKGKHETVSYCTICGFEMKETVVLPKTDHQWNAKYTVDRKPSGTEPGQKSIHCAVCGTIKERTEKEFYNASVAFKAASLTRTYSENQTFNYALKTKVTDGKITYSSSNTKVAKIDSVTGKVTIVGAGTATIKAKSAATEKYAAGSASCKLMVNKAANKITAGNYTKTSTGKAQAFTMKVTRLGNAKLSFASDKSGVKVTAAGKVTVGATFAGKATITIKAAATANYKATTLTRTVTVKPHASAVTVQNVKGLKLKASWKANKTATGYVIQYALNKDFTSGKKQAAIKNAATTAKTFTGLKKGKTYYVRLRAYRIDDGVKYYSAWSTVKSVKIAA